MMCEKEQYEVVAQTGKQGGKQVTDKAGYMKDQAPVADSRDPRGIGPDQGSRKIQDKDQQKNREEPRGSGDNS